MAADITSVLSGSVEILIFLYEKATAAEETDQFR